MSIKSFCKPEVIAVVGGLVVVDLGMIGYLHLKLADMNKLAKSIEGSAIKMENLIDKVFEDSSDKTN